jgi:nucleolar protein 15
LYIFTLKEKELTVRDQYSNDTAKVTEKKAVLGRERKTTDQQGSKPTWKDQGRGVVYLSHIPEGFFEEEMNSYFSQFGRVTRLNLVRSKKVCQSEIIHNVLMYYAKFHYMVAPNLILHLLRTTCI